MKLAYYPGCSLHASAKLYDNQCQSVLGKLGLELEELPDWNCCGATSAAKTDAFLSVALPARNLGIADAGGIDEVVIPCSSCYSRMYMSQTALAEDPGLKDRINAELENKVASGPKISTILEVLLRQAADGSLESEFTTPLEGLRVASYYGCLLTRFPREVEAPDDVENPQAMDKLMRYLGAESVDWAFKTDCCGASAAVNDAAVSLKMMSAIMKDALARGANAIVTSCPMCQFNLDAYQHKLVGKNGVNKVLPIYFITELVGLAMGMSPAKLQIDKHLTDAMGLIKELNLS